MTSLLPPTPVHTLHYRRQRLDERILSGFDAAIVVLKDSSSEELIKQLPHASIWRKLQALTHIDSAKPALHARAPNGALTAMSVGFIKDDAAPFACLAAAGKLVKDKLSALGPAKRVLLAALGFDAAHTRRVQEALLSAVLAATAPMPQYKSKRARDTQVRQITVLHTHAKPDFARTLATHRGNHLARWLTAQPPNRLNCVTFARELKALARSKRWRYEFMDEARLRRVGAGAFLAVARANAHRGAGIVKLSYRPSGKLRDRIALVGKGICFDTGGINLKSHKSMYQMHEDMMGSAVAVGTLLALTQLKAPLAVDCWLALTENEIGPHAYRPQEVVTAANGVTIQVAHSDAEGRMALADTLALASRDRPRVILDFATLTGACVGALTERMSGVFSNRESWRASLEDAGRASGERVWSFPMDEDYDSDLDSPIADILQCTPDSKGDHILAARFLSRFVGKDIGWVHVDLASANRVGGLAHIPTDVTGFGVRFAVEWLLRGKVMSDGAE